MWWPEKIHYELGCDPFHKLPRMFRLEQLFPHQRLEDVEKAAFASMAALHMPDFYGKRVAITAGSRGVANIALLIRSIVDFLKSGGAVPFIVPAMGSHGGASAEGQRNVLAHFGITEAAMGAPVISSMDAVKIGETENGTPVWCDRNAFEADGIVVCNRVKPHTDFKMSVESGLCKMMAVGLGKHKGASAIHERGVARLGESILSAARVFLEKAPILFGLAVVENAYEETMLLEAVPPSSFIEKETALLKEAKASMGRILLRDIDILVVEEIGKEISGSGMDPNITGRPMKGARGFSEIKGANVVVVLGVTELSAGNAVGIGLADITTLNAVRRLDPASTYTNGITAGDIQGCAIPLVANNDRDALFIAAGACSPKRREELRIAQIKNTLDLSFLHVSETFFPEVSGNKKFRICGRPKPIFFSEDGVLKRMEKNEHFPTVF